MSLRRPRHRTSFTRRLLANDSAEVICGTRALLGDARRRRHAENDNVSNHANTKWIHQYESIRVGIPGASLPGWKDLHAEYLRTFAAADSGDATNVDSAIYLGFRKFAKIKLIQAYI
jgi:hypothetical protein